MESPKSITWPKVEVLKQRVDFLSLASISEMRKIPLIPFPDDKHPKAVEFAMIVRNEFIKRLKSELGALSSNTDSVFIRARFYHILSTLRDEIVWMADNGNGWLEGQLEHVFKDTNESNGLYVWADRYLDSMLISIDI